MRSRLYALNAKLVCLLTLAALLFTMSPLCSYINVNAAAVTYSTNKEDTINEGKTGVYAYKMDDMNVTYYIIDLDEGYVYFFVDMKEDDTCYKLPIESGDLNQSLNTIYNDGSLEMMFTFRFKEKNKPESVLLRVDDAFDYELTPADLNEVLKIKETKNIQESVISAEDDEDDKEIMSEDGQVRHRKRIIGDDKRIDAIIEDMKLGSGEKVTRERAELIMMSMDVYTDSSREIKKAYNDPDSPYREAMEALDDYLIHAPKWSGTVYRGMLADKKLADEYISAKEAIDMNGPSSWTSDESIAQHYANDANEGKTKTGIVFVLNENKSGASITHLSLYGTSESEVLAPSGIKYAVDSYEKKTIDSVEYLYIYVHEMKEN